LVIFLVPRVRSAISGSGNKFPPKSQIFQFFYLQIKKISSDHVKKPRSVPGWPVIYCESEVCSGRVSGPISSFTPSRSDTYLKKSTLSKFSQRSTCLSKIQKVQKMFPQFKGNSFHYNHEVSIF